MAVTKVGEVFDGRDGGINSRAVREYTRNFLVTTDDPKDGPLEVCVTSGIPGMFTPYVTPTESDLGATVRDVKAKQINQYQWTVTVQYSSAYEPAAVSSDDPGLNQLGTGPGSESSPNAADRGDSAETNPTLQPPDVEWSVVKYQRVLVHDIQDRPVTNAAGEPFDPPAERDDTRLVLTYSRNELLYDPTVAVQYTDCTNRDKFLKRFKPGQVKVESITGKQMFENGISFYRVTYIFHFRVETFIFKILNQGYYELDSRGRQVLIRDSRDGTPLSSPTLLNLNGQKLFQRFKLVGDPPVQVLLRDERATFRSFVGYPETSYKRFRIQIPGLR
jgi:hypothetical protein